MPVRSLALVLAVLSSAVLSTPGPVAAAGRDAAAKKPGAEQPDLKTIMERSKACLRQVSAQAAKVTFDRKDLERYLAEVRSFDALDVDTAAEGPEGWRCVALDDAAKEPRYVAWARERRLDPRDWLLKSVRISLTDTKRRAPAQAAEMKAQMESQRGEMAKHCKQMGPNACAEMERSFALGEELMRESRAMMALLPEPTRAEAALLVEYDGRLREVMEGRRQGRQGEGAQGDPGEPAEAPADDEAKGGK